MSGCRDFEPDPSWDADYTNIWRDNHIKQDKIREQRATIATQQARIEDLEKELAEIRALAREAAELWNNEAMDALAQRLEGD